MAKKVRFASKIGLVAATVGSAVGLGNVWRFPAETQANGGAAFLILYIACVFILGIPVMISEFALGRAGRSDAVGAFKNLGAARPWWAVGAIGVLASYLILCFYMVVAGWTFEYMWQSATGALYDAGSTAFTAKMQQYIGGTWDPLINTYIMIGINLVVLMIGVQKGIERLSNILMPLLFLILILFACFSLTLPDAVGGLRFFLNPDFSKITASTVLNALGQAFFSLSLGMGILITYAAYYPSGTRLGRTAITVSVLDLAVAVLMGIVIFPAVTSFGLQGEGLKGATLVFITLPEVFARMPGTQLWSVLFFLLLTVAALTSTISIAEVSVSFIMDRFKIRRVYACMIVLLPLIAFSSLCSLSQGPLSDITICGLTIFDFLDTVATNIMLPVASLGLCIYIGWFAPKGLLYNQMSNRGTIRTRTVGLIMFLIRYVAPVLIAMVLLSSFL
ncbi:MAG: sodium-dependent transporter [Muribaculaceae bacterium]|nr:sodium-dependent transporter [Muribaculaceae bacterium]